jgi:hypothetical protein
MNYVNLNNEDVLSRITDKPDAVFEPFLDELVHYQKNSFVVDAVWDDLVMEFKDGRMCFDGYPLHPYVAWRITSYIASIGKNKLRFWEENPAIWKQVLEVGIRKLGDTGQLQICNDEIVAINGLGTPFYDHLDFMEPVIDTLQRSFLHSKSLISLTGFQMNPVWPVIRVVVIGNRSRLHHVGYQIEANYLFRKGFNRASLSHYVRDYAVECDMSLDSWWSVNSPKFSRTVVDLNKAFLKRFKIEKNRGMVNAYRQTEADVATLREATTSPVWRQAMLLKYKSQGASEKGLRKAVAGYRGTSKLSYAFQLLTTMKTYSLDRQILVERQISRFLKENL